jgi:hypothetical protein
LRETAISFVMSVCPHGTTRLPLDGFWWNLIFETFSKICWENSNFVKILQKWPVLYMKTFRHFWQYLAKLLLEWETFWTKVVKKMKTHFMLNNFFSENRTVYEIMSQNIVDTEGPQITIWRIRVACWISKATCTYAHAHSHATGYPHARTHARPPAQACTHRPICNTYCFSTATIVSWTRLIVTLYVHCLSC